jgi:hypothetical protein
MMRMIDVDCCGALQELTHVVAIEDTLEYLKIFYHFAPVHISLIQFYHETRNTKHETRNTTETRK